MRAKLLMTIILPQIIACNQGNPSLRVAITPIDSQVIRAEASPSAKIKDIQTPVGFERISVASASFGNWLREIPLKQDMRVYLYDGSPKTNQQAQFAVLDIPVGKKDLQQCADAIMRLRASFLLASGRLDEISFADNNDRKYLYKDFITHGFEKYLEKVYMHCGTLSLQRQLKKVSEFAEMQPGDVLIKGGSPGHAVIVVDMAVNPAGKKVFLLAQSYMPAQDIHILKNPANGSLNPWYELNSNLLIHTPEWNFTPDKLRTW